MWISFDLMFVGHLQAGSSVSVKLKNTALWGMKETGSF